MTKATRPVRSFFQATIKCGLPSETKNFTAPLEVALDPRVKTSSDDLRKQFDLMLKMRDRQGRNEQAILAIRDLRAQLQSLEKRLGGHEPAKPIVSASTDLRKKISAIEEELIQVTRRPAKTNSTTPQNSTANSATCKMPWIAPMPSPPKPNSAFTPNSTSSLKRS